MLRRSARPTAKAIAFFRKRAGYAKRAGESVVEARRRAAKALATAEAEASARGWRVEWEGDPDGDHENFGAILRDSHGHVVVSRWGIEKSGRDHRRVVEAELALEALEEKR